MSSWCSRCGARLARRFRNHWFETDPQCRECGVAATPPPMLRPGPGDVPFPLSELAPGDRAAVTAVLEHDDVPYRWEPDLVLMVPGSVAMEVRRIVGDVQRGDAGIVGDGVEGGAELDRFEEPERFAAGDVEVVDAADLRDGGEAAQAAMHDLFVAAVDLQRTPADARAATDFRDAASAVQASLPPFGIDPEFWREVQRRAQEVLGLVVSQAEYDAVAESARDLREALRDYV